MKLIKYIAGAALALGLVCACQKFDDSTLWQAINKNAADISALQEKISNLNSDIIALQQVVTALRNNDYITDCTPLADGTGYTIAFSSGKSIVIRNGKDGADGVVPQIGVDMDTDGIYYWTVDGEWLFDPSGNKVKAVGTDGESATAPKLKIVDDCWYLSTDNGVTWANLGKSTGEDGRSFFDDVIVGTETVNFILEDGTTIVVPLGGGGKTPFVITAVDLGLSVKWASLNIGATRPEEYGGRYQWAGLEDVSSSSLLLDMNNCPYHTGSLGTAGWTKYITRMHPSYWSGSGKLDDKSVLDPDDDIAHMKLGGKWRMPVEKEWKELLENCTCTWTDNYCGTGVSGLIVTGLKSGYTDKFIFLPAAGYRDYVKLSLTGSEGRYWSSTVCRDSPSASYLMEFNSSECTMYGRERNFGFSVRPVFQ